MFPALSMSNFHFKNLRFNLAAGLLATHFVLLLTMASDACAQRSRSKARGQFGVATILKAIDANGNGVLEPAEMKGRTQDFVRKAGLDPNRPQSVRKIAKLLEDKSKKDKDANKEGNNASVTRKVPGFGVDVELLGVADFSPSGEERMTDEAMQQKFGESIMAQTNRTMSRYDKDKNGFIDSTEQTRTRWTNPGAEESDTNKDGNLSRLELAYRYKIRADQATDKTRNNSAASRAARARAMKKTIPAVSAKPPKYNRSNLKSQTTKKTNKSGRGSKASSSVARGFNSGSDAYKRYAEGLLKSYDKNKDRRLSKSELKEMRRPPKNADTNKDGYVDKGELIASILNKSNGNNSSAVPQSLVGTRAKSSLEGKRRSENAAYNSSDSIFGGKDINNDRQLQMVEFAAEWDDKLADEFKSKDRNGDGVITEKEWNAAL